MATTWFAQNSSVNIDSANMWNDAAGGGGSFLTWASLGATDILVANGKTAIAINVNVTCAKLTTAATGGTAGGGFTCSASVTITANLEAGTTPVIVFSGTPTVSLIGNTTGGASVNAWGFETTSAMTLGVTGNITGGTNVFAYGAKLGGGTNTVTGNVTGATNAAYGIAFNSGTLSVTGDVTAGTAAISNGIQVGGSTAPIITGKLINNLFGSAISGPFKFTPGGSDYIRCPNNSGGTADYTAGGGSTNVGNRIGPGALIRN